MIANIVENDKEEKFPLASQTQNVAVYQLRHNLFSQLCRKLPPEILNDLKLDGHFCSSWNVSVILFCLFMNCPHISLIKRIRILNYVIPFPCTCILQIGRTHYMYMYVNFTYKKNPPCTCILQIHVGRTQTLNEDTGV